MPLIQHPRHMLSLTQDLIMNCTVLEPGVYEHNETRLCSQLVWQLSLCAVATTITLIHPCLWHAGFRIVPFQVFVWGIDAYDQFGRWGPPPVAVPQQRTFRQLLGVNGIWGWGFNDYSSDLIK